jgi:glc operon protein GlcG
MQMPVTGSTPLAIVQLRSFGGFQDGRSSMALTLDEANRIIQGAITKANELNVKVSVAICDAGGRLVAFQRMDNAIWASTFGSQGKAVASSATGRPSGDMPDPKDNPTLAGIITAAGGTMIVGKGGFPFLRGGVIEGACGVAGGTFQQEEDCARAAIERF